MNEDSTRMKNSFVFDERGPSLHNCCLQT